MKRIHLLVDDSKIVHYSLFPLQIIEKELRSNGYQLNYYYTINNRISECDFLLVFSKAIFSILNETDTILTENSATIKFLFSARKKNPKIIWLDNSDSTGVTHFEILPYVDLYLKKQLLKDLNLYTKEMKGGRIFTDFYCTRFNINDTHSFTQFYPLELGQADKVHLSWNIGLGDVYHAFDSKIIQVIRKNLQKSLILSYTKRRYPIDNKRDIDVFIRTSFKLNRESVAFHRRTLLDELDAILLKYNLNGSTKGEWLTNRQYRSSLLSSKMLPSPFGWGEIGVRDYEAFIYGALLIKPDMSHMSTWPDIFIPEKTYWPFKWDFSDLEGNVLKLIHDEQLRIEVARNGQEAFFQSISRQGMEMFKDHFIELLHK